MSKIIKIGLDFQTVQCLFKMAQQHKNFKSLQLLYLLNNYAHVLTHQKLLKFIPKCVTILYFLTSLLYIYL